LFWRRKKYIYISPRGRKEPERAGGAGLQGREGGGQSAGSRLRPDQFCFNKVVRTTGRKEGGRKGLLGFYSLHWGGVEQDKRFRDKKVKGQMRVPGQVSLKLRAKGMLTLGPGLKKGSSAEEVPGTASKSRLFGGCALISPL
jgi:hypothetical protein